jgi:DNA-binding MarR family transcriptional regulator
MAECEQPVSSTTIGIEMPRQTRKARLDALVAAFTELGPAWGRWVQTCMPTASISYIRMRLLHALECSGAQTMTQLASALGVTQRRVTALVDALEEDGLVERRPHPTDGRSTVVSLRAAGQAQQDINWQQQQTEIGLAFGDLSVEHQEQLLAITPALTEALRKRATEPDGGN